MAGREDGELGRSKSRESSRPRGRAPPRAGLGGGVPVVAFPLGLARAGRAGWRSRAGLRVSTFPPSLPPSSRAVPGGRANERREEGSGKQTLSAAALLPRPRPLRQRQVCALRVCAGSRPPARRSVPASQAAARPSGQPPARTRAGGRRAGWRGLGPGLPPPEDAGWQQSLLPASPTAPRAPPVCTRSASSWASLWTR